MKDYNINNFMDQIAKVWGNQAMTTEISFATKKGMISTAKLNDETAEDPCGTGKSGTKRPEKK